MKPKMETIGGIRIRRHGNEGPVVIVLHGGPGALTVFLGITPATVARYSKQLPAPHREVAYSPKRGKQ